MCLLLSIPLLILGLIYNFTSLGKLWQNIHVNSLIGIQKIIEESIFEEKFNMDLWFTIFVPVLELPLILFIALFFLFLFFKYK
tara:strand:+ start:2595 stop:2843 length:249 start_codon:yes stop_codon:yes gene_type:complete